MKTLHDKRGNFLDNGTLGTCGTRFPPSVDDISKIYGRIYCIKYNSCLES